MALQKKYIKHLKHDGRLSLDFDIRRNKTVLTNCYQSPPLKASRELYLNRANPSEATVYLMQSSGGLVEGDQNDYQVVIKDGANVCLIPQSATLIYPSHNGIWSKQNVDVTIGAKASLAWQTEAVIPFKEARFYGKTKIDMAEDATLLWGEILSPGRDKRGETFEYSDLKINFEVWVEGQCLVYDPLLFTPRDADLKGVGLLEEHLYVGSLWFVAPHLQELDMAKINDSLQQVKGIKVGTSLIEGKAVNVRWLATDMVLLKKEMAHMWQEFATKIM